MKNSSKKSQKIKNYYLAKICTVALLLFSNQAFSADSIYNCSMKEGAVSQECCDPSVTTCHSGSIPYSQGSSGGKFAINANKTYTMTLFCSSGKVGGWHYGSSGGSISCVQASAGGNKIELNCHNSSANTGHLWLNDFTCN